MMRGLAFFAACAAVLWAIHRVRRGRNASLGGSRDRATRTRGIPVWCADCATDETGDEVMIDAKLRRLLARDGRCATCGSASVVIVTARPKAPRAIEDSSLGAVECVSAEDLEHSAAVARLRATISGRPTVVSREVN